MYCKRDEYWDTSGQLRWSVPEFYKTEQFELNQKESVIKYIAEFIEEYPQGEYEIHLIHPYKDWDYDDYTEWKNNNCEEQENEITSIEEGALLMSKKIAEQKKIEEKEKLKKEKDAAIEREKQRELKLLAELKAKHEHNSRGE